MSEIRPAVDERPTAPGPLTHRTLLLGWGNPGRLDDGLGPALAEAVDDCTLPGLTVGTGYQLQVEDAAELASYDRVIFVDADRSGAEPFWVRQIEPTDEGVGFSSHSVTPGALLSIARDLFDARPEAWLVGVRGYDFDEFGEGLSPRARRNLEHAAEFIRATVETGDLGRFANETPPPDRQETDA